LVRTQGPKGEFEKHGWRRRCGLLHLSTCSFGPPHLRSVIAFSIACSTPRAFAVAGGRRAAPDACERKRWRVIWQIPCVAPAAQSWGPGAKSRGIDGPRFGPWRPSRLRQPNHFIFATQNHLVCATKTILYHIISGFGILFSDFDPDGAFVPYNSPPRRPPRSEPSEPFRLRHPGPSRLCPMLHESREVRASEGVARGSAMALALLCGWPRVGSRPLFVDFAGGATNSAGASVSVLPTFDNLLIPSSRHVNLRALPVPSRSSSRARYVNGAQARSRVADQHWGGGIAGRSVPTGLGPQTSEN
jgi:hypothetical protein